MFKLLPTKETRDLQSFGKKRSGISLWHDYNYEIKLNNFRLLQHIAIQ